MYLGTFVHDIYRLGNGNLLHSLQSGHVMIEFPLFLVKQISLQSQNPQNLQNLLPSKNAHYSNVFSAYVTAILISLETFCEFDIWMF